MEQQKFFLTQEGKRALEDELNFLVNIRRPEIIKQIQDAREQGDLSENADYDAAKNAQAELEKRIAEIKNTLDHAEIIEDANTGKIKKVELGCSVEIYDLADKQNYTYSIVGEVEADPAHGKISYFSPLAKAVFGKKVGDTVEIKGIEDTYQVKILSIKK